VRTLPILLYHKIEELPPRPGYLRNYVTPAQFVAQLEALRKWSYTPIALEDWLAARANLAHMPARPIVLTLDDGYASNYETAWPILQRYDANATVFLVADFLGKTNAWDSSEPQVSLLNVQQIRKMQAAGIRFGSHSSTHRSLTTLSEPDVRAELTDAKNKLESILARPVQTLAYPYNHNNWTTRSLARKTGYQAAVVGRGMVNAPWTNPWALRRILIHVETTLEELRHRLDSWRWLRGF
jgi:peptidoglycan/xylan/chitin deacetylase (PgdA/CDA1 family)